MSITSSIFVIKLNQHLQLTRLYSHAWSETKSTLLVTQNDTCVAQSIEENSAWRDITSNMLLRCLKWKSTAGLASFLWKPNCTRSEKQERSHYPLKVKWNNISRYIITLIITVTKFSNLIGYKQSLFSVVFIWLDNLRVIRVRRCRTVALEWLRATPFYISTLFPSILLKLWSIGNRTSCRVIQTVSILYCVRINQLQYFERKPHQA